MRSRNERKKGGIEDDGFVWELAEVIGAVFTNENLFPWNSTAHIAYRLTRECLYSKK
jgi:hypothetical protein